MSDKFPINRGVRQDDPVSPKLFTAVLEKIFKKTDISEEINVDGQHLTNLKFVYDVGLFNNTLTPQHPPPPPKRKKPKFLNIGKTCKQSKFRKF